MASARRIHGSLILDYRAINFLPFADLDPRVRSRLITYFQVATDGDAATRWLALTTAHDDQAADLLALAAALSCVDIRANGQDVSAFDLVDRLHLLAGDRLYGRLSKPLFEDWKTKGIYRIRLANGRSEEGRVRFNHGQLGASLHEGFDIQGVTALNRIPRLQWNYRFCDSLADIDVDGYSPWDFIHHPTYANSDPRQWDDRFRLKFGNPGYDVEKVGNVPVLKVRDTSTCPSTEHRLSSDEQAAALATASRVSAALDTGDGFRDVVQAHTATLTVALRDVEQSPLVPEIDPDVLVNSSDDDLIGYYTTRVITERLLRISPAVAETPFPLAASQSVIATPADLSEARARLEAEEFRQRVRVDALDTRPPSTAAVSLKAWLSTDDRSAFGYPAGTRFVAAETGDLQMLLGPRRGGYDLLFAVPRTKY